jgi:transposase
VVPKLSGLLAAIEAQVSRHPDATIAELRAWLRETHKVSASTGLMNKTLATLGLTFKKSPSTQPSKRVRMLPRPASNGANSSPS